LQVDPFTHEAIGVTYCTSGPPAARIDRFDANGRPFTPVVLPLAGEAACMIHDCAITASRRAHSSDASPAGRGQAAAAAAAAALPDGGGYVVVLDFALTVRPARRLPPHWHASARHGARWFLDRLMATNER
jgi:hypothetical protein